jgi:hypothetical protein
MEYIHHMTIIRQKLFGDHGKPKNANFSQLFQIESVTEERREKRDYYDRNFM